MALSKDEVDLRARQLWQQREQGCKMIMFKLHGVEDYQTLPWERATERGRNLLRKQARWLYKNKLPNDWMLYRS